MTIGPGPYQPPKKWRGWLPVIILGCASLLASVGIVAVGLYTNHQPRRPAASTSQPAIHGTSLGRPASPEEIAAMLGQPWAHFKDRSTGEWTSLSKDAAWDIVSGMLGYSENLQIWQLCRQELTEEAWMQRGYEAAQQAYPRDMPRNRPSADPNQAAVIQDHVATAVMLEDAAALANRANVACTLGIRPPRLHWVVAETNVNGGRGLVAVPDALVMGLVGAVEAHLADHDCTSKWLQDYAKLKARPIATKVAVGAETFSQQAKFLQLRRLFAQIRLFKLDSELTC